MNNPSELKMDREWHRREVKRFMALRPRYQSLASVIEAVLKDIATKVDATAVVQVRVKSQAGFSEKLIRKWRRYSTGHQVTDLVGGRIIVHTQEQVNQLRRSVEKSFIVVEDEDTAARLAVQEFGYLSRHTIVSLRPDMPYGASAKDALRASACTWNSLTPLKAEIQVRTLLQHAWADLVHDRVYKNEFDLPVKWRRISSRLAAVLEEADSDFVQLVHGVDAYKSYFGAYMTADEMREEIEMLTLLMADNPGDLECAGRICKVANAATLWDVIVDLLEDKDGLGASLRVDRSPELLRELGNALCQKHTLNPRSRAFKRGQRFLEKSLKMKGDDANTLSMYAGSHEHRDADRCAGAEAEERKAHRLYQEAFRADPDSPYHFASYITLDMGIAERPRLTELIVRQARGAVETCRAHIAGGIEFPRAQLTIGRLSLLLGDREQCLQSYIAALRDCINRKGLLPRASIRSEIRAASRLKRVVEDSRTVDCARRLLMLAEAALFQDLAELKKSGMISTGPMMRSPVVVIAGGSSRSMTKFIRERYAGDVQAAFSGFTGTLCSGGTISGVAGLAGDIAAERPHGDVDLVGYLPEKLPSNAVPDPRYTQIFRTRGDGFSPLEPIQYWVDILASEIAPSDVKVVGIAGGEISAFEYRLAAALGAKVILIPESGGAADEMLRSEEWQGNPNVIPLPVGIRRGRPSIDRWTLAALLVSPGNTISTHREKLAEGCHEHYLSQQRQEAIENLASFVGKRSLVPWERLDEDLKESNRAQADHMRFKLRMLGMDIIDASKKASKPFQFTKKEIAYLSELEHGRWNAEKLLNGWRYNDTRNDAKKHHPDIVPWSTLPDFKKEWDRNAVKSIPVTLASVGLEIRRGQ